ncbi:MAG: OmpA family protein [Bdellovibrionales bacterium]|nr:OmpA family protein [Bdellovibrionales bacterium]
MNMTSRNKLLLPLTLLAYAPFVVHANDLADRRGLFPFFGLGFGYQSLSTSVDGEVNKTGTDTWLRAIGSYYKEKWVFDGGLGYNFSRISGSNSIQKISPSTDAFTLEFQPRYRINPLFQLGPTLTLFTGTDNSYSEVVGSSSNLFMAGVHALFDIPTSGDPLFRAGLLIHRSLNLSSRSTWVAMVDLQIGFDFFNNGRKAPPPREPELPPPPPPAPAPAPEPIAQVTDLKSVLVRFPEDRLLFQYKMSHLTPERRKYLASFAQFLANNPDAWESVAITGHTDSRGTDRVNDELSAARAKTVFDVLVNEKVPGERMTYKGMGSRLPINAANNEEAWRVNRRVEMEFHGVTNPNLFSDRINEIDRGRDSSVR